MPFTGSSQIFYVLLLIQHATTISWADCPHYIKTGIQDLLITQVYSSLISLFLFLGEFQMKKRWIIFGKKSWKTVCGKFAFRTFHTCRGDGSYYSEMDYYYWPYKSRRHSHADSCPAVTVTGPIECVSEGLRGEVRNASASIKKYIELYLSILRIYGYCCPCYPIHIFSKI